MDLTSGQLWKLAWGLLWRQALIVGVIAVMLVVLREVGYDPAPGV